MASLDVLGNLITTLRSLRMDKHCSMDVLLLAERAEMKAREILEEEVALSRIDADISTRFEIENEAAIKEEMRSLLSQLLDHKINVLGFVARTKKEIKELLNKPPV